MSDRPEGFIISSSPHVFAADTTQHIMLSVIASLLPAIVMSVLYFGFRILMLFVVAIGVAVITEGTVKRARGRDWRSVSDGSAVLTAILLVMTLPPTISPLLVGLGTVVAIFIGKEVFGGLGSNIFNPALVGRAFLSAAYPVAITRYVTPRPVFGMLAATNETVGAGGAARVAAEMGPDAVSAVTPLAAMRFDGVNTPIVDLAVGQIGGSIGETSAVALLVGGTILLALRIINWRLVTSYLGTVFAFSGIMSIVDPGAYPDPLFHIFAGGLILAAFYMATDMVTSPYTAVGNVIFGVGAGVIVVVIRLFGAFPEGVMYSILLMNAVTPVINRYTNTGTFGSRPKGGAT